MRKRNALSYVQNYTMSGTWAMALVFFFIVVSFAFFLPPQTAAAAQDQAGISDALKTKIKAFETLSNSSMTTQISESRVEEARALIMRARYDFIVATGLIKQDQISHAERKVDIALQKMSKAIQVYSWNKPKKESKQSKYFEKYKNIIKNTNIYRNSFLEAAQKKGPAIASLLNLRNVDRFLSLAEKEAEKGQYRNAASIAEQAYMLTESAIIKISENVTVVYENTFQTPADEYRYEQERFDSYGDVVMLKMSESQLTENRMNKIQSLITEGEIIRQKSDDLAATGKYTKAIEEISRASSYMIRALKVFGVMVERYDR